MSTIKQKTVVVELADGSRIEVRRMRWKGMRDFLRKFAAAVASIVTDLASDRLANPPAEGEPVKPEKTIPSLLMEKLPEVIIASDELSSLLCSHSCGLSLAEFDDLDALSASQILKASLELNLDDELKNCWAGIVVSLAALMPAKQTTP